MQGFGVIFKDFTDLFHHFFNNRFTIGFFDGKSRSVIKCLLKCLIKNTVSSVLEAAATNFFDVILEQFLLSKKSVLLRLLFEGGF